MKQAVLEYRGGFRVHFGTDEAQAAEMVIERGDAEGGPGNRHRGADQWLYVIAGEGEATVEGERVPLGPGSLLLIERGERHQVRATGSTPLKTLNFYTPPAYREDGEPLPAGKD